MSCTHGKLHPGSATPRRCLEASLAAYQVSRPLLRTKSHVSSNSFTLGTSPSRYSGNPNPRNGPFASRELRSPLILHGYDFLPRSLRHTRRSQSSRSSSTPKKNTEAYRAVVKPLLNHKSQHTLVTSDWSRANLVYRSHVDYCDMAVAARAAARANVSSAI